MAQAAPAPDLTAVVVNYNAGEWLARSLGALALSEPPPQAVLVDNASSDTSLALAEQAPLARPFRLLRNDQNLGYAKACNRGAAESVGDLVFVNPDCVVQPQTLGKLQAVLEAQPKAGVVGALVTNADGSIQRASLRRMPTVARTLGSLLGLGSLNLPPPHGDAPQEVEAVSGALLLVRRRCFEELGGFDENYFLHCEDLDLMDRARRAGWQVWLAPAASAVHVQGVSHRSAPLESQIHKHRSLVRFFGQRLGAPGRWIWSGLIWLHFLALAPRWWWQGLRRGRAGASSP
ncbi:MAG: glycosyltransferase family 2 protein [Pseudomonadota bacterium]